MPDDYDEIIDAIIADLEECGGLEWIVMDGEGERLFRFHLDIVKEVMPELYEVMMEDINDELMHLYSEGLVELEYTENLEPLFKISEKGRKYLMANGYDLGDDSWIQGM